MRPYLRVANVLEAAISTDDVMEMNFEPDDFERYRLRPGDILLNEGQSPELLGRPAMYTGRPADTAFTNSLIRFQAEDGIEPEWALLVFRHLMHSGRFRRESRITTNIAHLSSSRFKKVEFPVPPTAEQRRIVAALDERLTAAESARADTARLARRLTSLVGAVLNQVVRDAAQAGAYQRLGVVAEVKGGIQKQPKRHPRGASDGVPFLRVANVGRRSLDLRDVHRILLEGGETTTALLQKGDLLVVEGNGSPDQIGRAALWDASIEPCTHQNHLIRVRPTTAALVPEYLELVWNAPVTAQRIKAVASTTSGLYTLSTKKVSAIEIPLPPLAVQQELVRRAEAQLALAEGAGRGMAMMRKRVGALERSLLAAAFNGRLTVQDPTDEPADALLGRIEQARKVARATDGRSRGGTVSRPRTTKKQENTP